MSTQGQRRTRNYKPRDSKQKLVGNVDSPWQNLLRNKYLTTKSLTQVQAGPTDSHFWRGLMRIKDEILAMGSFNIKDETQTRFWEDTWACQRPLKEQFPALYNIAHYPHATVEAVLRSQPLNISFQRALVGNKLNEWLHLVAKVSNTQLCPGRDMFKWNLKLDRLYTVRSYY